MQQIGIEMHTSSEHIKGFNINYRKLLNELKTLPKKEHNFILTGYNPNLCMSKKRDNIRTYYSFFDVLFLNKNR